MRDYIEYLRDVLGIQQALIPNSDEVPTSASFYTLQGEFHPNSKEHYELIFLNLVSQPKESLFRPEVHELFEKMKSAMRLKNIQVIELDCILDDRTRIPSELNHLCETKFVVMFSSFPRDVGEFILKGTSRWLETYSPAYLLEDPNAKKVVWNDLQKVMKELGL